MFVNNEIGVIQPIKELGDLCHRKRVFFHTDAAQALGKVPIDVDEMNIDLMVDAFGNIPGDFMNFGFVTLKPFALNLQKYYSLRVLLYLSQQFDYNLLDYIAHSHSILENLVSQD